MLRPDEIELIRDKFVQVRNVSDGHIRYSGEFVEDMIKAINLAGYKLVKSDE